MNETWLAHHGIKGQRWGIRRFQNKDGSLTSAGKKRSGQKDISSEKKEKFWTDDRKKTAKKVAVGAAVVGGTLLAAYGAVKLNKAVNARVAGMRAAQHMNLNESLYNHNAEALERFREILQ